VIGAYKTRTTATDIYTFDYIKAENMV